MGDSCGRVADGGRSPSPRIHNPEDSGPSSVSERPCGVTRSGVTASGVSCRIPLSGDRGRGLYALVSPDDFEWAGRLLWHLRPDGYVGRTEPKPDGGKHTVFLHREVNGTPAGYLTDHINNDKLDNRRENLRTATDTENNLNRRQRTDNTSGFRGVSFHKATKKWQAAIACKRKWKSLGYFATREDAARAYDAAALQLHGEFARLNFPDEVRS